MQKVMAPAPFTISKKWRESHDCYSIQLEPLDQQTPLFEPGQFNMLYLFGIGEAPISISAEKDGSFIHTIRSVGSVTTGIQKLKTGDTLGVRGPFGRGWPIEKAKQKDALILAGGIGLAPLRPLIYQLLEKEAQYGRIILLYGARTPKDLLFFQEMEELTKRTKLEFFFTVDRPSPDWKNNVGVVTQLVTRALIDPHNTVSFVCGPEIMMRFSIDRLIGRGVSPQDIFLSMEKNMRCGVGICGHCQAGGHFVCKDGPVFALPEIETVLRTRGL